MLQFINKHKFLLAHYLCCFTGFITFITFSVMFITQNHSNILKDTKQDCEINNFNQTICSNNIIFNDNAMNIFVALFVIFFTYVGILTCYLHYAYHNRNQNNNIVLEQL